MKHKILFVSSCKSINKLLVISRSKGCHTNRLRFSAREKSRAMCTRQNIYFANDCSYSIKITAINPLTGFDDVPANNIFF